MAYAKERAAPARLLRYLDCLIMNEFAMSLALGESLVNSALEAVSDQEVPLRLVPLYIVSLQPVGSLTDDAQWPAKP